MYLSDYKVIFANYLQRILKFKNKKRCKLDKPCMLGPIELLARMEHENI